MSSSCRNCNNVVKLAEAVADREFGITYRFGCGFSPEPPRLSMQSGRKKLWAAPDADPDAAKMLLISNIDFTTCGAFEPQLDPTKTQEQ